MISSYSLSAGEGQQVGVGGAAQTIATAAAARYQHPLPQALMSMTVMFSSPS